MAPGLIDNTFPSSLATDNTDNGAPLQPLAYRFKTVALYSNISKTRIISAKDAGEVSGCGSAVPAITNDDINAAPVIVAQMGPEPFMDVMAAEPDFDIIIGGRSYDPSPYIAYTSYQALRKQALPLTALKLEQLGGFAHMGKIMECGAVCATPKSASAKATIYQDGTFDIIPLSPDAKCLPSSVAAHTLYEKTRPDLLPGPGGVLDLNNSTYEQLSDGRSVRVRGGRFLLSRSNNLPYTVKLESGKLIGYRTMIMGGFRDPILIKQIDHLLTQAKGYVAAQHKNVSGSWDIDFHVYGAHGIMESLEPGDPSYIPRELFVVGEALASSQELANSVAATARIACTHGPYPGQRATAGNFAFGICGKIDVEMGPCAEFCVYHLLPLREGEERAREVRSLTNETNGYTENGNGNGDIEKSNTPLFTYKKQTIGKGELPSRQNGADPVLSTAQTRTSNFKGLKAPPPSPVTLNLSAPHILADIAPVVRSKNAGPFELTLDVIFSHSSIYNLVKASNLLTRATIARLYHLSEDEIIFSGFYDPALAFKATIPRKRYGKVRANGGYMETDVHGSQQHVGLLELELGQEVSDRIRALKLSE